MSEAVSSRTTSAPSPESKSADQTSINSRGEFVPRPGARKITPVTMIVEHNPTDICSPKRQASGDRRTISDWYGYYAGYSIGFVRDALSVLKPRADGLILDPWNGAGTSTAAASLLGFSSFGSDINPVMAVISRSRSASDVDLQRLEARIRGLGTSAGKDDGLHLPLFSEETCFEISRLRRIALRSPFESLPLLSDDDCVLLTALFLMVRKLATPYQGSNPAWWKSNGNAVISRTASEIDDLYLQSIRELVQALDREAIQTSTKVVPPKIEICSSAQIPLPDSTVSAVITSPPYLTRLDYVKAMRYELAVLLGEDSERDELRRQMIGSVMGGLAPAVNAHWGDEAGAVLDHALAAAKEKSRGDGAYYFGTFARYFSQLYESFAELHRVLECGGQVAIVVQGSRHRGRVIDLPVVVEQMGASLGWSTVRAVAWPTRDLARINTHSRKYGNYQVHETAVLMRKP